MRCFRTDRDEVESVVVDEVEVGSLSCLSVLTLGVDVVRNRYRYFF